MGLTNMVGDLPGFGQVWFYDKGIANILSLAQVKKRFRVTYDSSTDGCFVVHKPDGKQVSFHECDKGLHYLDMKCKNSGQRSNKPTAPNPSTAASDFAPIAGVSVTNVTQDGNDGSENSNNENNNAPDKDSSESTGVQGDEDSAESTGVPNHGESTGVPNSDPETGGVLNNHTTTEENARAVTSDIDVASKTNQQYDMGTYESPADFHTKPLQYRDFLHSRNLILNGNEDADIAQATAQIHVTAGVCWDSTGIT
jgi:hypothetical protein